MSFDRYRSYTQARIGLGHHAPAMPTKDWLLFAYHHACAIDAVRLPWNVDEQKSELEAHGIFCDVFATQIKNRDEYLMRPDLGRKFCDESTACLQKIAPCNNEIAVLLSNGLSSIAVKNHVTPFLILLRDELARENLTFMQPIVLVENGRVGLIDHLGSIVKAKIGLVIIGERPGLSAPDSLAVYLTYQPQLGLSDASRNCISNIRPPHGLSFEAAARKTRFLISTALSKKLSGVHLKEEADSPHALS